MSIIILILRMRYWL